MFLLWSELLQLKGNAGSKQQHVCGCSLVWARKFYGYHSSEELFVKIDLYPNIIYPNIILSLLEFSYIHIIVKSMFIELLDKDIAIIRMLSPMLPIFFWYTSWTFDWCSVVFWNPFVVLFLHFSFSSTPLLILAHLVELFSFATTLSWHFFCKFYHGIFIFCTIQRFLT